MRFFLLLIFLFFFTQVSFSQNDSIKNSKIDSLNHAFRRDSLHTFRFKKLRPYANIDNRNSFIKSHPANFRGLQLGAIINEYHTFGFGVYRLIKQPRGTAPIKDSYQINNLQYLTFFYEYFLINKKYVEVDLPFEAGIGSYRAKKVDNLNQSHSSFASYAFVPLGAAIKVILKPCRWIGVSFMGGYRYVFEEKPNLNLDGTFYSFGVWVDIRQIYRDIKFYGFQKRKYKREMHKLL